MYFLYGREIVLVKHISIFVLEIANGVTEPIKNWKPNHQWRILDFGSGGKISEIQAKAANTLYPVP